MSGATADRGSLFRRLLPLAALATALAGSAAAKADPATAALPTVVATGEPAGTTLMAHSGPARAHHAPRLTFPSSPAVLWRRRVPGGAACNLLVDDAGRIFVTGYGRVSQFSANGALEFTHRLDFDSAQAAALLSNGTRVVLDQSQRVWGISATGLRLFSRTLATSRASGTGSLLPLTDGGVLIGADRWLFNLDASGRPRAHAEVAGPIRQTLRVGGRLIAVGVRGEVSQWDGYGAASRLGSFGGNVRSVTAVASGIIALVSNGRLVRLDLNNGVRQRLTRNDEAKLLPLMAATPERLVVVRADGTLSLLSPTQSVDHLPPGPSLARHTSDLQLLSGSGEGLAWLAADTALTLAPDAEHETEMSEVQCPQPVSLVATSYERLAVVCRSGLLWVVGPRVQSGPASTPGSD